MAKIAQPIKVRRGTDGMRLALFVRRRFAGLENRRAP
jgi:hypothetical protein